MEPDQPTPTTPVEPQPDADSDREDATPERREGE